METIKETLVGRGEDDDKGEKSVVIVPDPGDDFDTGDDDWGNDVGDDVDEDTTG